MDAKQKYDRQSKTVRKLTEGALDIRNRRRALPAVDAELVTSLVRNWPRPRAA
ncbi:MAG: hypothetical protein AAFN59_09275 [Pseudomonadota bacterium]